MPGKPEIFMQYPAFQHYWITKEGRSVFWSTVMEWEAACLRAGTSSAHPGGNRHHTMPKTQSQKHNDQRHGGHEASWGVYQVARFLRDAFFVWVYLPCQLWVGGSMQWTVLDRPQRMKSSQAPPHLSYGLAHATLPFISARMYHDKDDRSQLSRHGCINRNNDTYQASRHGCIRMRTGQNKRTGGQKALINASDFLRPLPKPKDPFLGAVWK